MISCIPELVAVNIWLTSNMPLLIQPYNQCAVKDIMTLKYLLTKDFLVELDKTTFSDIYDEAFLSETYWLAQNFTDVLVNASTFYEDILIDILHGCSQIILSWLLRLSGYLWSWHIK